jgi:hypothetical protein
LEHQGIDLDYGPWAVGVPRAPPEVNVAAIPFTIEMEEVSIMTTIRNFIEVALAQF